MGGLKKIPAQGGGGGKRGHSNMEHSGFTDETKEAARRVRRLESKRAVRDGLREATGARLARMDPAGLPALVDAIKHLHGLDATWLESVPVREVHAGLVVWEGEVQVFEVRHPKASRVYSWSHETEGGRRRFHAVLGQPPVTDATMAVRTAVLSETSLVSGRDSS